MSFSFFTHLECTRCAATFERDGGANLCASCRGPLFARYAVAGLRLDRDDVAHRARSIWRWHEMMPVLDASNIVSLGEGMTPLLPAPRLGAKLGFRALFIQDEGNNPTGSFKARGLSAAVSRAKELGHRKIALPTAGNAGGAAAAYAAKAGMECHVFMPADTPPVFRIECERYGAKVTLVDGLIDACGRIVAERAPAEGWHDVSTLKEPYRVEGKKTMGYELAESFVWELPDAILYPTGGGTGLIGMWKAFDEMEALDWIGSRRPRMISVQAAGCAPIPRALERGRVALHRRSADRVLESPTGSGEVGGLQLPSTTRERCFERTRGGGCRNRGLTRRGDRGAEEADESEDRAEEPDGPAAVSRHTSSPRYLKPVPVLNRTMRERGSSAPVAARFFAAAQTAPPSGATKRPSDAPISSLASRISSSVTAIAVPPEARIVARMRSSA